jgi:tRNA(His) 5'-end guanylyltransferase
MMTNSLGDRMKANYEKRNRTFLTRRTPVILRIDGKAFHTFTKGCKKPFDIAINSAMIGAAKAVMNQSQGARLAYVQSDEISVLLCDYDRLETSAWFDYNVQKLCSVAASIATATFNREYWPSDKPAMFDCRAFNIPKEEVSNYFFWRWQDWVRNSILMVTQYHYSHKQMQGKKQPEMIRMLAEKGVKMEDFDPRWQNGTFIRPGLVNSANLREGRAWIDGIAD